MFIDTHCHLNDTEAFPDPQAAILEAKEAGVDRLIIVGIDVDSSELAVKLTEENEGVYAIVGWHPNYADNYSSEHLKELKEMGQHKKVVAIGEIGLDYYRDYALEENQLKCLYDQLDLALELKKPVVFHCRSAYKQLLNILEKTDKNSFLIHCFSGNEEDAKRAMALDCYFGIDGPITYKKADEFRELVKKLPQDRLVIETDSPWLSPHPFRGKPNKPAYLSYINVALAQTLDLTRAETAKITTENAQRFFGI